MAEASEATVVVTDEIFTAFRRGLQEHLCGPDDELCCDRAGLTAAAPLIVEHYLRTRVEAVSVPEPAARIAAQALREAAGAIRAEQDRRAASQWGVPASQRPQLLSSCLTLHEAAKIVDGRADELERASPFSPTHGRPRQPDRGTAVPCEVCSATETTGDPALCAGCRASFNAWRAERGTGG